VRAAGRRRRTPWLLAAALLAATLGYQLLGGGGGAQERLRLRAPALVWIGDELTYRLEARVSRERALEIARALR
jgi:hypothetical protein